MSQPPSLGNGFVAPCQCLIGVAETKQDEPQNWLLAYVVRVDLRPVAPILLSAKSPARIARPAADMDLVH